MFLDLALQLGPPSGNNLLSNILSFAFYGFFFLYMFFGQQIQSRMILFQLDGAVRRLEFMKNESKNLALKTLREIGKPTEDPTVYLGRLLEGFFITPVDMDPTGIVRKLDHLVDIHELKFKDDVRRIAPQASEAEVNNLSNVVEIALALNQIYKIVRHFYLLGKKTSSYFFIFQLQMAMPIIMQAAEAYANAGKAFADGKPVGDGIGALVASRLMKDHEKRKVEKDIVVAETTIEGRRVIALKAEGPGGNVGKPGDAVKTLCDENVGKLAAIVMIDAALKLEGEKTGEVTEGIGAAIGGLGTEKYKIEEEATKLKIPVYAIIVKQTIQEAITPMKKEIAEAAVQVLDTIKRIIVERTKEGQSVIVAGIGNTIGIGQ